MCKGKISPFGTLYKGALSKETFNHTKKESIMADTKTINLRGDEQLEAHRTIKAYAAITDQSIGEVIVELTEQIDLEELVS
jgi:uncharacterized protein YqfB (UPF0267 family)